MTNRPRFLDEPAPPDTVRATVAEAPIPARPILLFDVRQNALRGPAC